MTQGTFGLNSIDSSASAALQSSLESRLRANLDVNGSPEYRLTWKLWAMPSGQPICALRASAHRISGSGFTGWPTPHANFQNDNTDWQARRAKLKAEHKNGNGFGLTLGMAAQLAGWPTPQVYDGTNEGVGRALRYKGTAPSEQGNTRNPESRDSYQGDLKDYAMLAGWVTPQAKDYRSGQGERYLGKGNHAVSLNDQTTLVPGPRTTRSTVQTEGRGALDPAFSRWLMGYPPEWDASAPTAEQLSHLSRRSSSARSERQ